MGANSKWTADDLVKRGYNLETGEKVSKVVEQATNTRVVKLEILGIPKPKQSARFRIAKNKMGGQFIASYQKKEVKDHEANVGYDVRQQLPEGFIPFDEPIYMKVDYIFPLLTSMSKKVRKEIEEGKIVYRDTKPDLPDNLNKGTVDALAGIVFVNDSRIVAISSVKFYGLVPKTKLEFGTMSEI